MGIRWVTGFTPAPTISTLRGTAFSKDGYTGYLFTSTLTSSLTVRGREIVGAEIILVGAGGAGGQGFVNQIGGGGGGGGEVVILTNNITIVPNAYPVVIGIPLGGTEGVYGYSTTAFGYEARGGQNGYPYSVQSGISSLWRGGKGGEYGGRNGRLGGDPAPWSKELTDNTGTSFPGGGGGGYASSGATGSSGGGGGTGYTITWMSSNILVGYGGGGGTSGGVGGIQTGYGNGAGGGGGTSNGIQTPNGGADMSGLVIVRWPTADNPHT